ncbi:MAG: FAD-dependent oxidoreductase [Gammaproteobacteria bacterium]|nr:FAD-dependent oxidoreductase [Gammaproteobacteria bacterium]
MNSQTKPRVAIIGSGISGLTAAYRLHNDVEVTIFEQNDWIGGHTHTVDVTLDDQTYAVDTGFIVFNEWTYPRFLNLLSELGLSHQDTDMSFSVMSETTGIEYAGTNLSTLFAQRHRLLSPGYYRFLLDIVKFNKTAIDDLAHDRIDASIRLETYLKKLSLCDLFHSHYLLPMAAAIWSSDLNDVNQMPALFFIRFFKNHGLLSVTDRPQWYTLPGGSRSYIAPLTEGFRERIRLNTPVVSVRNTSQGVEVVANANQEFFDAVVLASHSDQSLALLDDTETALKSILQGIPYADNEVVLHTDRSQMPKSRRAWASWNYQIQATPEGVGAVVTYDMNRLQNLNGPHQFFVTLNNTKHINPDAILGKWTYAHPQFGPESLAIQAQIDSINAESKITVAGAWCRNGFHEDGVVSGEKAAEAVKKTLGIYA